MSARAVCLATLALGASATAAHAEPIAIGVAPSAYLLSTDAWGFEPELLGHTYVALPYEHVYLRPGARLSTRGLIQDDMSTDLRLEEHDVSAYAELGIVHSGHVVPSVTVLGGVTRRALSLHADGVDTSMSRANATEWLPSVGAQVGLGLPLSRRVLVEPFARYELVFGDARTHLRWGVEATVSFGR